MTVETNQVLVRQRLSVRKNLPDAYDGLVKADRAASSVLESSLCQLVKLRASQVNGCAYCIDMHSKDARRKGETEQRLYALDAWRETSFYSARERAALQYSESATRLPELHVPDDVYVELRRHFTEPEIAALIVLVAVINAWNRIAVSCREPAGSYRPKDPR